MSDVTVLGAAGDLDNTWGGDGTVTTGLGAADAGEAVVVQPDGKILVAGSSGSNFALTRYEPAGGLDTTFSQDGKVTTAFGGVSGGRDLALQPDGKIVVSGFRIEPLSQSTDYDFAVARYNSDGSLDTTFSGDGKIVTGFGGDEIADGVAIQPDGKIVAGGSGSQGSVDVVLARYNPDGSLDGTFGNGDGKVEHGFGGTDVVRDIALQSTGKIVVAGYRSTSSEYPRVMTARFNTDGAVDTTYGAPNNPDGAELWGNGYWNTVTVSSSNQIFAVGETHQVHGGGYLMAKFGGDGSVSVSPAFHGINFPGTDRGLGVAMDAMNRMVATGTNGNDFLVLRYQPNSNVLDTSFSSDGIVMTNFGGTDVSNAAATLADNRIVAAGRTSATGSGDFAIARYLATNGADLSVTQTDTPDPVTMGRELAYTITVAHNGVDPTSNVTLVDDLPDSVTFNSANPSCTHNSGIVTCNLGTMSAGNVTTRTIRVTPTTATTITNVVTVGGTTPDFNTANNTDQETTNVMLTQSDLSVTKNDAPDPVSVGSNATYEIAVSNAGPDTATGVALIDELPTSTTFVSATPSSGSCAEDDGVVTCALGSLANGGTASVSVVARTTRTGAITNVARVSASEGDPDGSDNVDVEATDVQPDANGCSIVGTDDDDTIVGSAGNDKICSLAGNDIVDGLAGDDILLGGDGDDTLTGSDGLDQLFGEAGNDALVAQDGVRREIVDGGDGDDTCTKDRKDKKRSCVKV